MDLEKLRAKLKEALRDKPKAWALLGEVNEVIANGKPDFAFGSELEHAKTLLTEYYDGPYVSTYGAKSFKDLAAAATAQESAAEVGELTEQYRQIIGNIMYGDGSPADKVSSLRRLSDEFMGLVTTALNVTIEVAAPVHVTGQRFAESIDGADIALLPPGTLTEDDAAPTGARAPLYLNVKLIKPGRGNARDNHFYPADVLKRDAHIFEGVDMYTTDHRAGEKSERTKVSRIKEITSFATDGAPIARVVVFDPDFAEKVRNRAAVGELSSLECSILAGGTAKPGKCPDGRDGNIVESITSAASVDWVTKAGAGGQAVSLVESAAPVTEGKPMNEAEKKLRAELAALTAKFSTLAEVEVSPEDLAAIGDMLGRATAALTALSGAVSPAAAVVPPEQVAVKVAAEAVVAELAKTNLPAASKARLAGAEYATLAEVTGAALSELEYIKTITGSGKPFSPRPAASPAETPLEERAATADSLIDQALGRTTPARK